LGSIGSALSREKLDSDSLVKILWPKEKCRLLRDDVVLVDRYKKSFYYYFEINFLLF
jgi:hypothetical protein